MEGPVCRFCNFSCLIVKLLVLLLLFLFVFCVCFLRIGMRLLFFKNDFKNVLRCSPFKVLNFYFAVLM